MPMSVKTSPMKRSIKSCLPSFQGGKHRRWSWHRGQGRQSLDLSAAAVGCSTCPPPSWSFASVSRRSARDHRRRSLGQNFLRDRQLANALASRVGPGELVVEFGAGHGAVTIPLARTGAQVLAIERDLVWVHRLTRRLSTLGLAERVQVRAGDLLDVPLPRQPYRVVASPPFNLTTALLHRLLDDPIAGPERADLVVQWEVALKRSVQPPRTLLSTTWAPWWQLDIVRRIPRHAFRPTPAADAAWLTITKRRPPILSPSLAPLFSTFVRLNWGR
jgi:23S rRNA (adenine-N6)-dimethyltransferase